MTSNISEWTKQLDPNLISVVLPTYNRSPYLNFCLTYLNESLFKNLEVIIVDDGSSEQEAARNRQIFKQYESCFTKLKYIALPQNSGTVSLPRNIGISHITGGIIAPTDDDCWPTETKFEVLYRALTKNESAVLAFGNRCSIVTGDPSKEKISDSAQFATNKTAVGIDNGQFIYKAQVYEDVNPVLSINACDWSLYSSFAHLGDFAFVDSVVCWYVWHGKNISLTPKSKRVDPLSKLGQYKDFFADNAFTEKVFNVYGSTNT